MENGSNRGISPCSPTSGRSRSRSHSHQRIRSKADSRSHSRSKSREYSRRKKRSSESPKRSYFPYHRGYGYESRNSRYGGHGSINHYSHRFNNRGGRPSYNNHNHNNHHNNNDNLTDSNGINRENPPEGRCLGVFGLSVFTTEKQLRQVFGEFGGLEDVQLVFDAQTGKSRGFAFVYYELVSSAKHAKEKCNGIEIDGRKIRVDFSLTQRAHTPTPGIYMGRNGSTKYRSNFSSHHNSRYNDYPRDYYDNRDRPFYPQFKRRYSRSKSRSPRHYYHEERSHAKRHYSSSGFKDDYSRY